MSPVKLHPSDAGKFGLLCARDADFSLVVPHQSSDPEEGGRGGGRTIKLILKNKQTNKSKKLFKDSRKGVLY